MSEYAPGGSDQISFKWPTHIAFGPKGQEVVTDLKNNRFLYRDGPGDSLKVSPIPVRGQHSVAVPDTGEQKQQGRTVELDHPGLVRLENGTGIGDVSHLELGQDPSTFSW